MKDTTHTAVVVAGVLAVFLAVQIGALALIEPFKEAGFQATEDPKNPLNSVLWVGFLLVATGGILLIIKYDLDWLLRAFILVTSGFISAYVFSVLLPVVIIFGVNIIAYGVAAMLVLALYAYPEWWVIDTAGIVMGMGAAALFGISFGVLPAIVLLAALAIYDAISVYGTEHMLTLASGVMELRLPIVLVFPTTLDYSFREDATAVAENAGEGRDMNNESGNRGSGDSEKGDSESSDGEKRDSKNEDSEGGDSEAYFIGLGDAVMPTIMVASAAFFLNTSATVFGVALPAVTAIIGTLIGLLVLLRMVFQGRAHAGLPLLNGGAICGYLIGALVAGIPLIRALGLGPYV